MCGISLYIEKVKTNDSEFYFSQFMKMKHRGPDKTTFICMDNIMLGFHRLAIMDKICGDQPFVVNDAKHTIMCICNGEIYNYVNIANKYGINLKTQSDCEVIPYLYRLIGFNRMIQELRGEFSIILISTDNMSGNKKIFCGRDQTGVRPLFFGSDSNGIIMCSELKGAQNCVSNDIIQIRGGEYIKIDSRYNITKRKYFDLNNIQQFTENISDVMVRVKNSFIDAVECRLKSERMIGCLLSGGLDSSLVTAIAARYFARYDKKIKTFSIGIPGSTDRKYAEQVSSYCMTDHTHVEFTVQDFLNAIPDVIKCIESYDITSVRASTGQYLISRWIRENTDIKVLLIGDGSDELTGGYMYFHNAPNPEQMHAENVRLLQDIIYFDVLRADRGIANNGLEARVPFLDHHFVSLYLSIDPKLRMPKQHNDRIVEKWLLRKSFSDEQLLPNDILWRKKEAFSDGVSSTDKSWYIIIQEHVNNIYNSCDYKKYNYMTPYTKESYYYREIWSKYFNDNCEKNVPYFWLPKWCDANDPSARVLTVY
jgi:asparagine synthase (glutamine-hydrolysing)